MDIHTHIHTCIKVRATLQVEWDRVVSILISSAQEHPVLQIIRIRWLWWLWWLRWISLRFGLWLFWIRFWAARVHIHWDFKILLPFLGYLDNQTKMFNIYCSKWLESIATCPTDCCSCTLQQQSGSYSSWCLPSGCQNCKLRVKKTRNLPGWKHYVMCFAYEGQVVSCKDNKQVLRMENRSCDIAVTVLMAAS